MVACESDKGICTSLKGGVLRCLNYYGRGLYVRPYLEILLRFGFLLQSGGALDDCRWALTLPLRL